MCIRIFKRKIYVRSKVSSVRSSQRVCACALEQAQSLERTHAPVNAYNWVCEDFELNQIGLSLPTSIIYKSIIRNNGPSITYVTLFWTNFDSLPLSHFVTHFGTP